MGMFKNKKLATRVAVIISVLLAIVFTGFIGLTVLLIQGEMSVTISAELSAEAAANGAKIQQVFNAATDTTSNMRSYLEDTYKNAETINAAGANNVFNSSVYGRPLKQVPYEMEKFLVGIARSTVRNNPDITGVGAMFEPKRFAANLDSYAFYVDETNVDSALKPFQSYDLYSQEDYYQEAVTTKSTIVSEPYDYEGNTLVTTAAPVIFQDTVLGVLVADIKISDFNKIVEKSDRFPSLYTLIVDNEADIIYDSRSSDNVGRNLEDISGKQSTAEILARFESSNGQAFDIHITNTDGNEIIGFFSPISAGDETWWSITALMPSDMNAAVVKTSLWLIACSLAALFLLVFVVVTVLRKMLKPIQLVVNAAKDISAGKFDIELRAESGDEIGVLTQTFSVTAQNLRKIIQDISRVLEEIANRNLNVEPAADYVGDLGEIKDSILHITGNLNEVMEEINESASLVSNGADQVSGGAQELSQGAASQASSVEELAAAIMEISEKVKSNADSAQQASGKAEAVGEEANDSNRRMQEMLAAMNEISQNSGEIGKIIKTVEDIAFQTNILALNASVEAARAGAAGKGFAVVADEVRNLASKSAEASKNTAGLIQKSLTAIENGARIADETAKTLGSVVEGVKEVSSTLRVISGLSAQQAESIVQINQGIDQISGVVQTNSATAEESAAASQELSSQAQMLKNLAGQFQLKPSSADPAFFGLEV